MEGLICDENFRWSGIRTNLPGSHQLIHSDARISPETGLRKELTVLIYTQPSFDKTKDEGSLEIWDDDMQNCTIKFHLNLILQLFFKIPTNLTTEFQK